MLHHAYFIAKNANFAAPLTAVALQQFVSAASSGLGNEDDAAVAKIYARNAGIELTQNNRSLVLINPLPKGEQIPPEY